MVILIQNRDYYMKHEINWSDLIIEKGVFDPLGIWRVGDRLIGYLLSPFTTVVAHRPARYFSMYCWILYYLNQKKFDNDKIYWKRFYAIESVFLCAIRTHEQHNYKHFQGQIGTGTAKENIARIKKGMTTISKLKKTNNGWEANYKKAMYDFLLIETDYAITSKVKLTKRGEELAKAYHQSIEGSEFYRQFIGTDNITFTVIENLSKYSCPCLLYYPKNELLKKECEVIISNMLTEANLENYENYDDLKNILSSIHLILNCLMTMNENGIAFSKERWRKVLSIGLISDKITYRPPSRLNDEFKKWEIYNLDSVFIYSLESGLCGFLECLHKNRSFIKLSKFNSLGDSFETVFAQFSSLKNYIVKEDIEETLYNFINLLPEELRQIEDFIIDKIANNTAENRIVYSFFLYLLTQASYYVKYNDKDYGQTIHFYLDHSEIDGLELSMHKALKVLLDGHYKKIQDFFLNVFLKKWIVERQLYTRNHRGKDVAWFSYNNETKSYNWEASYKPGLYRAARSEILMTFLLNLNIVDYQDRQWQPADNISLIKKMIN